MKFEKKVYLIFNVLKNNDVYSDTRLLQQIFENYRFFDYILNSYLKQKKELPKLIKSVFYVAFSEIFFFSNNIDAFTINNAINFVKKSKFKFYSKILHAVLSRVIKNKGKILEDFKRKATLAQFYSHPDWLVEKWIKNFGLENTKNLMKFNNSHSYNYIIIKNNKIKGVIDLLKKDNINFSIIYDDFPEIIRLEGKYKISGVPGFKDGLFWVQDPSAYFVTKLVDYISEIKNIVDLCASPGGKSIALSQSGYFVISNDVSLKKIGLIKDNIERLSIDNIKLLISDAREIYFRKIFDLVLLDVPCSGTGVINKKGDIRWNISFEKINSLKNIQYSLLENALNFSKYILYSTCTLEPEENELLINEFVKQHKEVEIVHLNNIKTKELLKFYHNGFFYSYPFRDNINGAFAVILKNNNHF